LCFDRFRQGILQFCAFCLLCFLSINVYGQVDTTKFEEVVVFGNHPKIEEHKSYSRDNIEDLAPTDLGVLLKRVAGATIADYGGVGSMKTMSMRGLGSTHSGLLINGYPQSNAQSSQIDFGNIQVENIENITVQLSPSGNITVPVSSQMQGNFVSVETFEQSFTNQRFSFRGGSTMGSFARKELNTNLKVGSQNSFLSFSGNLRSYDGDFNYSLPYNLQNESRQRSNNEMSSYLLSVGAGKKWKSGDNVNHRARFFANLNHVDRSLPGAIILYNSPSMESLLTENKQVGGDYSLLSKRINLRSFLNISSNNLRYHDPEYFNTDGFIDNRYFNQSYQTGINAEIKFDAITLLLGNDTRLDNLNSSRDLGTPVRLSNIGMIGSEINLKYFGLNSSLFYHYVSDHNSINSHSKDYMRLNPQISLSSSDKLFEHVQLVMWYKHSSRAPSFNELYYSQIGNTSLEPEESQQANTGYIFILDKKKISGSVSGNIFLNRVSNKIVALPTQNLFVWSIQNVGKVLSYGKDIALALTIKFSDNCDLDISSTTTYQSVTDRSSTESPSYGHQIANTPQWTNTSDIQLSNRRIFSK
jgi:outer membrane cobalamin receptor